MSAVEQVLMLWLGIVTMDVAGSKIELAWATRSPKAERLFGWVLRFAGLWFIVRAALDLLL